MHSIVHIILSSAVHTVVTVIQFVEHSSKVARAKLMQMDVVIAVSFVGLVPMSQCRFRSF
jgi:hypothetical protein